MQRGNQSSQNLVLLLQRSQAKPKHKAPRKRVSAEQRSSDLPICEVYHSMESARVQPPSQIAVSETRSLSAHAGTQT